VDLFKDAIDAFNRAGNLAHGADPELEAISAAWLGNIYY
jgi:hypothetical protein